MTTDRLSSAELVFTAAFVTSASAATAGLFTSIGPLGGAIFGFSSWLSSRIIYWICDKVNCCPDHLIFRTAQLAFSTIASIAAAALITTTFGFPMTVTAGFVLTAASLSVTLAASLVLGGCFCLSAISTGVALGTDRDAHRSLNGKLEAQSCPFRAG